MCIVHILVDLIALCPPAGRKEMPGVIVGMEAHQICRQETLEHGAITPHSEHEQEGGGGGGEQTRTNQNTELEEGQELHKVLQTLYKPALGTKALQLCIRIHEADLSGKSSTVSTYLLFFGQMGTCLLCRLSDTVCLFLAGQVGRPTSRLP